MGILGGYKCSNCNYEKTYFIGVGFMNQKEKFLFDCDKCSTIKQSTLSNPKCSKCNSKSLNKIEDFNEKLTCPKCGKKEFNLENLGMWD